MVVNEGVFLIEDTHFHSLEIIECFIKLMCQYESQMGSFINSGPKGTVI